MSANGQHTHLLVLAHGLWGYPADWACLVALLKHQLPGHWLVHASSVNAGPKSHDGIDVCGARLAEEIRGLVAKSPGLKRLSLVGHSMGGLLVRYAMGELYDPQTQRLAGLEAAHLVTMATPHAGCGTMGVTQVPFLSPLVEGRLVPKAWRDALHLNAAAIGTRLFGRTVEHLFLAETLLAKNAPATHQGAAAAGADASLAGRAATDVAHTAAGAEGADVAPKADVASKADGCPAAAGADASLAGRAAADVAFTAEAEAAPRRRAAAAAAATSAGGSTGEASTAADAAADAAVGASSGTAGGTSSGTAPAAADTAAGIAAGGARATLVAARAVAGGLHSSTADGDPAGEAQRSQRVVSGRAPLLLHMTEDRAHEGRHFMSALRGFRSRTCYANAGGDHLVGHANASLRCPHMLKGRTPRPHGLARRLYHCTLRADDVAAAFWNPNSRDSDDGDTAGTAGKQAGTAEAIPGLQAGRQTADDAGDGAVATKGPQAVAVRHGQRAVGGNDEGNGAAVQAPSLPPDDLSLSTPHICKECLMAADAAHAAVAAAAASGLGSTASSSTAAANAGSTASSSIPAATTAQSTTSTASGAAGQQAEPNNCAGAAESSSLGAVSASSQEHAALPGPTTSGTSSGTDGVTTSGTTSSTTSGTDGVTNSGTSSGTDGATIGATNGGAAAPNVWDSHVATSTLIVRRLAGGIPWRRVDVAFGPFMLGLTHNNLQNNGRINFAGRPVITHLAQQLLVMEAMLDEVE